MSREPRLPIPNPLDAHQYGVKFYAGVGADLRPSDFIPVFHAWIRDRRLETDIAVDVANYAHVHRGPEVLLMCHEGHYGIDQSEGRLGLVYTRKRESSDNRRSRFRQVLKNALNACRLLENEPSFDGRLRFRYDEALFLVQNRLLAPRNAEAFDAAREELEPLLSDLFTDATGIRIEPAGEEKGPFAMRIAIEPAQGVERLLMAAHT